MSGISEIDEWATLIDDFAEPREAVDVAERERLMVRAHNARTKADDLEREAGVVESYDERLRREAIEGYRRSVWWRRAVDSARLWVMFLSQFPELLLWRVKRATAR